MPVLHVLLTLLGLTLLALTLPLLLELFVLSLAAILPARPLPAGPTDDLRLAIVIPAHNEEKLIAACIASIRAASGPSVTIYTVAHNCTDSTAARASQAGARVLVLQEDSGKGKGAALNEGFTRALDDGADAVMAIDADSIVSPQLIPCVMAALRGGSQALQCRYVVANPDTSSRTRLMALAFLGFNVLRPRGRSRLGLSCGIFGNGFALTAATMRAVPYTATSVVEDLEYHLHLVRAGVRVDFMDNANVFGEMPEKQAGASTQRARWEGGRLLMRRKFTLPLLREVLRGHLRFLEPLFDLLSLPLATEAGLLLLALLLPLLWLRIYAAAGLFTLLLYVLISGYLSDKPWRSLRAVAYAPFYILFKLAVLPRTWRASRQDAGWVRTQRNDEEDGH